MKGFLFVHFKHDPHQRNADGPQLPSQLAVHLQKNLLGYTLQLLLLGNSPDVDGLTKTIQSKNLIRKTLKKLGHVEITPFFLLSSVIHAPSTDLWWDGTFDTAELLDGAVEVVSVADHDAHHQLHIWLSICKIKLWMHTSLGRTVLIQSTLQHTGKTCLHRCCNLFSHITTSREVTETERIYKE